MLVPESSEVLIVDNPKIVKEIESKYFRYDFYTKLNYFKTHQVTKFLSNGSLVNLAKRAKMIRYSFGEKVVNANEKPAGAFFMINGKADIAFEKNTAVDTIKGDTPKINIPKTQQNSIAVSEAPIGVTISQAPIGCTISQIDNKTRDSPNNRFTKDSLGSIERN